MSNGPPDFSRNSDARDTLEVSADELKRASQLPLDVPASIPPPLPPQADGAEHASRAPHPSSLAPTFAPADSGGREDLAPAFRITLALAGALLLALPFVASAASQRHGAAMTPRSASAAPTPAPMREDTDRSCTEATALEPEQLIELDSVRMSLPAGILSSGTNTLRKTSVQRFFDPSAAESAVRAVSGGLRECGPNAKGHLHVAVTFAPSGSATVATVEEERLRATPTGSCVALHLRNARILAFNGRGETVRTTLLVD